MKDIFLRFPKLQSESYQGKKEFNF
jgi:hypothetical protein